MDTATTTLLSVSEQQISLPSTPFIINAQDASEADIDLKSTNKEIIDVFIRFAAGSPQSAAITQNVRISKSSWKIVLFNAHVNDPTEIDSIIATYRTIH